MEIHLVKLTDKDYPLCMNLVDNKEKYDLVSMDNVMLIPLFQVIDILSGIKSDVIIRDGIKYCSNCGARMVEPLPESYIKDGTE